MSIIHYNNRLIYKKKQALKYIFHKSTNFKVPPGYHSADICIVGGGASGITAASSYNGKSGDSPQNCYGSSGGNGGYVKNLYGIDIPDSLDMYVELGKGGELNAKSIPNAYAQYKTIKKDGQDYGKFTLFQVNIIGGGGQTFIKNNLTKQVIASVPGGAGFFMLPVEMGTEGTGRGSSNSPYSIIYRGGGANLGGGARFPILIKNTRTNRYEFSGKYANPPINGQTDSPQITVRTGYPAREEPILFEDVNIELGYSADFGEIRDYEIRYLTFLLAATNSNIDTSLTKNIGYGTSRIFGNENEKVAGGGCGHNFWTSNYGPNIGIGQTNEGFENESGGGCSPIIRRENAIDERTYRFSVVRNPGNGEDFKGGGGAAGIYSITSNRKGDIGIWSIAPGKGGCGLCVIIFYPNEKRPENINFIRGSNEFIIE